MSKPLEALADIKREAGIPYFSTLYDIDMWWEDFNTVEAALNRLEELEKVLKIVKKKGVGELSVVEDMCNWDWNKYVKLPCSKLYTKIEFDLLKEVFEDHEKR